MRKGSQKFKGFIAEGMAFDVPSWKDAPNKGLAAGPDTSLVPDIFAHRFEDLADFPEPLLYEVQMLTKAKRSAALMDLYRDGTARKEENSKLAEQSVSILRINLLNKLILNEDEHLCIQSTESLHECTVSVQYRRLYKNDVSGAKHRAKDTDKLHQIQSTMSWNGSHDLKWVHIGEVCATPEEPSSTLLTKIVKASTDMAIKDGSTSRLRKLVNHMPVGEALNFEYVAQNHQGLTAIWQPSEVTQSQYHTFSAVIDVPNEDPVVFTVLIGVLDINFYENWHNMYINKYVQNTVRAAGEQAIRMMADPECDEDKRNRLMWNILKPCIRISQGGDVHVLSLSPFANPDSCTVTHIFLKEDVDGICDLGDKTLEQVAAWGKSEFFYSDASQTEVYHCAATQTHKRFNEQELAYLHSRAFMKLDANAGVYPIDKESCQKPTAATNLEDFNMSYKSARIAFTEWDVLVTSIDSVMSINQHTSEHKTIITLVNYPPAGARYTKDIPTSKPLKPSASEYQPGKRKIHDMFGMNPGGFRFKDAQPEERRRGKESWTTIPSHKHMYFIPGLHAHSYQLKEWHVWLADVDPMTNATKEFMKEAMRIRDKIWTEYHDVWDTLIPKNAWMNNIEHNTKKNEGGDKTIRECYVDEWRTFLLDWVKKNQMPAENASVREDNSSSKPYIYCEHIELWHDILDRGDGDTAIPSSVIQEIHKYARERYAYDVVKTDIKPIVNTNQRSHPGRGEQRKRELYLPRHPSRHMLRDDFKPRPDADYNNKGKSFYIPAMVREDDSGELRNVLGSLNVLFFVDNSVNQEDAAKVMTMSRDIRSRLESEYESVWKHPEGTNDPEDTYYYNIANNEDIPDGKVDKVLFEYVDKWADFVHAWILDHPTDDGKEHESYFVSLNTQIWSEIFPFDESTERDAYMHWSKNRYNHDTHAITQSDELGTAQHQRAPKGNKEETREHTQFKQYNRYQYNTAPHEAYANGNLFFIPGLYKRAGKVKMNESSYNIYCIPLHQDSRDQINTITTEAGGLIRDIRKMFHDDDKWEKTESSLVPIEKEVLHNIELNILKTENDQSIHEFYLGKWRDTIQLWIMDQLVAIELPYKFKDKDEMSFYLYCDEPIVWKEIFSGLDEDALMDAWIEHSAKLYREGNVKIVGLSATSMIPLPPSLIRQGVESGLTDTVAEMKERIQTLEARLTQDRQNENRDHLLKQVLAKLSLSGQ